MPDPAARKRLESAVNLTDRIAADEIEVSHARPVSDDDRPDWIRPEDRAWRVTLINRRLSEVVTVPFYAGPFWADGRASGLPTAADVLEVMLSDASGYLNASGNFQEWCEEFGYDPDDYDGATAQRRETFDQIGEQVGQLETFLGDRFEAYVWQTNHDG